VDEERDDRFRDRLSQRTDEAVSEIAQALLDHPLLGGAVHAAGEARDRALAAQRSAMQALDVSSASDVERLERRIRALAERVEELERQVDRK
jgi:uncharacterized protein YceH (UPF0502 family)